MSIQSRHHNIWKRKVGLFQTFIYQFIHTSRQQTTLKPAKFQPQLGSLEEEDKKKPAPPFPKKNQLPPGSRKHALPRLIPSSSARIDWPLLQWLAARVQRAPHSSASWRIPRERRSLSGTPLQIISAARRGVRTAIGAGEVAPRRGGCGKLARPVGQVSAGMCGRRWVGASCLGWWKAFDEEQG